MLEYLSVDANNSITLAQLLFSIGCAFLSGLIISLTYIKTNVRSGHSENFALTIILLPAVIASIIMLIGSDIAKAFSLAGAFSIIRFRSAPGEPKDIAFVLFVMAAGLAAGVGAYGYAVLFTMVVCLVMIVIDKTNFGRSKVIAKRLQITIPEDLDYDHAFKDILDVYTNAYKLVKIKTTAMGSLYQLTYQIVIDDNTSTKAFIDELRCRNGNLNISLMLPIESEV